jgi:hypothetical protein
MFAEKDIAYRDVRITTEIAIYCDMSQTLEYQMNHDSADPKQKRERFQQLTQI